MTQVADRPVSEWQGSLNTYQQVRSQIVERWGSEEAEKYNPHENCFTFNTWKAKGYKVKKGEKALRSFTFVKQTEIVENNGHSELHTIASHPKTVCLFYYLQVEKQ